MPDYAALTANDARQAITRTVAATYAQARRFADGDHWQDTAGWIGAQPYAHGAEAARVWTDIHAAFISANKVGEIVGRHVAGVVGHEPRWSFTVTRPLAEDEQPNAAEAALIAEAEALLTDWWDRVNAPETLAEAVAYALLGERGVLRAYVPEGRLVQAPVTGETRRLDDAPARPALVVPPGDMAQQLARLELEALPPERAAVLRDRASGQDVGVVAVPPVASPFDATPPTGNGPIELHYLQPGAAGGAVTVIETGDALPRMQAALPLGGRLLVAEIRRAPLITAQILRLQMALNHALTMMLHNTSLAGSTERILTNAQRPGSYAPDAEGAWVFTPEPLQVGAGTTTFAAGIPLYSPTEKDAEGNPVVTGYTTPGVTYRDPSPVDTFTATQDQLYATMLAEAHQRHALIAGDAAASGESRIQARADYAQSLAPTARAVEGALRAILEAVLAAAAHFAGQAGRFAGLRAEVACQIDTGPLTAAEIDSLIKLKQAGLRSAETAMAESGVADTDAELARIAAEREARPAPALPTTPATETPGESEAGALIDTATMRRAAQEAIA